MAEPLTLPKDSAITALRLADYLGAWAGREADRAALAQLVQAIAEAAVPLAARLALGALPGDPTAILGTNDSGDKQKALDVGAHLHFVAVLRGASVRAILSEEADEVVELNPEGRYNVALDPIDGSDSIGIGAPLGLLFCVFPAAGGFLRPGRDIVAAGYVLFGHTTDLGFSLGDGVALATLEPAAGAFRIVDERVQVPAETKMIAFNAANHRHWAPGLRRYIDDCLAGRDGPRGRDVNMRWIAASVADLHRILRRGGLFLYPADAREGYENGRLRLTYEAFPIAWLMEQAGAAATDGERPILDRVPASLHQNTPLIFGSREEVAALRRYLDQP